MPLPLAAVAGVGLWSAVRWGAMTAAPWLAKQTMKFAWRHKFLTSASAHIATDGASTEALLDGGEKVIEVAADTIGKEQVDTAMNVAGEYINATGEMALATANRGVDHIPGAGVLKNTVLKATGRQPEENNDRRNAEDDGTTLRTAFTEAHSNQPQQTESPSVSQNIGQRLQNTREGLSEHFENAKSQFSVSGFFADALSSIGKVMSWLGDTFNIDALKRAGSSLSALAIDMTAGDLVNQGPNMLGAQENYEHEMDNQPAPNAPRQQNVPSPQMG